MASFQKTLITAIVSVIVLVTGVFDFVSLKNEFFPDDKETETGRASETVAFENVTETSQENLTETFSVNETAARTETEHTITETAADTAAETTAVPVSTAVYFIESTTVIEGRPAIVVELPQTAPPAAAPRETKPEPVVETDADGKININTADRASLMSLPGIVEVKSQAIIDYRNEHGRFSSAEKVTNVSGIGEKTFEKIKDRISY